jgi:hypothetical protein
VTNWQLTATTIYGDAVGDDVNKDRLIAEDKATPSSKEGAKKKRA